MKKKEPFALTIDLEQEFQEYMDVEPDVSTPASVLAMVESGVSTMRIGKYLLVAREIGNAADILQPTKTLLLTGAAHNVNVFVLKQKRTVKFGERTIELNAYKSEGIGRHELPDEENAEWQPTKFVRTDNPEAAAFAQKWLDTVVLGHLRNHLAIIRASKGKQAMLNAARGWLLAAQEVIDGLSENGD